MVKSSCDLNAFEVLQSFVNNLLAEICPGC